MPPAGKEGAEILELLGASYRSAAHGFLSRKVRLKNNWLFYQHVVGRSSRDSENLVFINH